MIVKDQSKTLYDFITKSNDSEIEGTTLKNGNREYAVNGNVEIKISWK